MTTKELTAETLLQELVQFNGTENYIKNFTGLYYTDGVEYLAERAGAYWLIDLIGSHLPSVKQVADDFFSVSVEVHKDYSCNVLINHEVYSSITNEMTQPTVASQNIGFTDLPEGEYSFFLTATRNLIGDNQKVYLLMLPSEY